MDALDFMNLNGRKVWTEDPEFDDDDMIHTMMTQKIEPYPHVPTIGVNRNTKSVVGYSVSPYGMPGEVVTDPRNVRDDYYRKKVIGGLIKSYASEIKKSKSGGSSRAQQPR